MLLQRQPLTVLVWYPETIHVYKSLGINVVPKAIGQGSGEVMPTIPEFHSLQNHMESNKLVAKIPLSSRLPVIKHSEYKARWASCTPPGTVLLSFYLCLQVLPLDPS